MTKKLILSSIAASALALATLSYAAPGSAPKEPAPATQVASKIDMAAALQAAQAKFPEASALSASLHGTRGYGLVWDARIIAANGAAAAGDAATVLGSASRFVGNPETGKEGSDESAFSSRDKRRFFVRDSGAPFCLAKEQACGLDAKTKNVQ